MVTFKVRDEAGVRAVREPVYFREKPADAANRVDPPIQ